VDDDSMTHSFEEGLGLGTDEREAEFGHTLTDIVEGSEGPFDYADRQPDVEGNGELRFGRLGGGENPFAFDATNATLGLQLAEPVDYQVEGQRLGTLVADRTVSPGRLNQLLGRGASVVRQKPLQDGDSTCHVGMIRVAIDDVNQDSELPYPEPVYENLPFPEPDDAWDADVDPYAQTLAPRPPELPVPLPVRDDEGGLPYPAAPGEVMPPPLPQHRRVPLYNPSSEGYGDVPSHVWFGPGSTAKLHDEGHPLHEALVNVVKISPDRDMVLVEEQPNTDGSRHWVNPAVLDAQTPGETAGVPANPDDVADYYQERRDFLDRDGDFDIGERELPEGGPGDLGMHVDPILDKRARAMAPADLPPGMAVSVEAYGDGFVVTYEPLGPEGDESGLSGGVYIQRFEQSETYPDLYEVANTHATQGWGPLLYDVAMELATLHGDGVVSDRTGVSDRAQGVWRHYDESRQDVHTDEGTMSTRPAPSLQAVPALQKVYRAQGTPTLDALREMGLLIEMGTSPDAQSMWAS
jgi:hypothetical protein